MNSSSELGNIFVRELVTDCKKSICHCKGTHTHTQSMKLDANTSVTTCVWENNKQTQCFFLLELSLSIFTNSIDITCISSEQSILVFGDSARHSFAHKNDKLTTFSPITSSYSVLFFTIAFYGSENF